MCFRIPFEVNSNLGNNKFCIVIECTDKPSDWALAAKWSCQTYVVKGYNMTDYCSKNEWKDEHLCGATCGRYGITTNPDCSGNKPTI